MDSDINDESKEETDWYLIHFAQLIAGFYDGFTNYHLLTF